MFIGNFTTKVDDKGRIKIPARFRKELFEVSNGEVIMVMLSRDRINLYPKNIWEEELVKISRLDDKKLKKNMLTLISYTVDEFAIDSQGRVGFSQKLKDTFEIKSGENLSVVGNMDYIYIYKEEYFEKLAESLMFKDDEYLDNPKLEDLRL